jgi:hypothetical protein
MEFTSCASSDVEQNKKKKTSDVSYTLSVYFVNIVSETVILIKYCYHLAKRGGFGISFSVPHFIKLHVPGAGNKKHS